MGPPNERETTIGDIPCSTKKVTWWWENFGKFSVNHGISTTPTSLGVSKNSGTPKSSILIGFALINHPFWGTIIFGNTQLASLWNLTGRVATPEPGTQMDLRRTWTWSWLSVRGTGGGERGEFSTFDHFTRFLCVNMDVSKNSGTPKWMV